MNSFEGIFISMNLSVYRTTLIIFEIATESFVINNTYVPADKLRTSNVALLPTKSTERNTSCPIHLLL
jgi:hypothetical protein